MQKLAYTLRFHRAPKSPEDPDPPAVAQSIQITTKICPDAINATFDLIMGEIATMTNTAVVKKDGKHFTESGTIKFAGGANTLSFKSVGDGTLLGGPDQDGFHNGTVMWIVVGGTGIFEGATGAITSNFLVSLDTDELIDYQFYLLYVP